MRAFGVAVALVLSGAASAAAQCPPPAGDPRYLPTEPGPCMQPPPPIPPLRIGAELLIGGQRAEPELDHRAVGVAVPFDVQVVGPLWGGLRAQYLSGPDQAIDTDQDGKTEIDGDDHRAFFFTAGPRLVVHTEPARREAWRLSAGTGWMEVLGDVSPDGPVVELAIERQAGLLLVFSEPGVVATHGQGRELTLSLRGLQGLGDAKDYRALLVGMSYAHEYAVPLPEGETERGQPDVPHTFGGESLIAVNVSSEHGSGITGGFGLYAGLPFGDIVEMRARGDVTRLRRRDGPPVVQYAALGGFKLARTFPAYLEVLAGWGTALGAKPRFVRPGALLDVALGAQAHNLLGCGIGVHFGVRTRAGLTDGTSEQLTAGLVLGVDYDSAARARSCQP